jgi:hypothetical protein
MRDELDRILCERYPGLFADRKLPVEVSPMGRGFECDDGWFELIETLCYTIQWWTDHCGMPPVSVRQVKEKFGSLRFYYSGGNEVTLGMKAMAENMSARICEKCGVPGELRENRNYRRTLCDKHANSDD